jgi:transcription initiation factor TFIIB
MSICCSAHPEAHIYEDYHAGDMICSECGLVISERYILES